MRTPVPIASMTWPGQRLCLASVHFGAGDTICSHRAAVLDAADQGAPSGSAAGRYHPASPAQSGLDVGVGVGVGLQLPERGTTCRWFRRLRRRHRRTFPLRVVGSGLAGAEACGFGGEVVAFGQARRAAGGE
jgi:hypothetical protein